MKRDLYFKELALVLGRAGFTLRPQENDFLPVEYHSQRLCRVNDQGNVFYRQEEVDSPEREQARVKVTDMAGTVLEYMSHLEHAPVLQAIGLSEPYQSLAEFNGTVLAGRQTEKGAMYAAEHAYVMTSEQIAFLEPTLVELLGATCLYAMAETVDEAERRGINRDAAVSFLVGHIYNLTCNFLGYIPGKPPVSDACKVAIGLGNRLVMREDWKRIWDDEVLHKVINTMLHPDQPQI